jgi:DNA adenine methylase
MSLKLIEPSPPAATKDQPTLACQTPQLPLIRWAGSKRQILSTLAGFWNPRYKRYIEPFVGCAALFLKIQPSVAVLGDLNDELINTYKEIRENADSVYIAATSIPINRVTYNEIRARATQELSARERAVRFLYLNRFCFNGIYRTNMKGLFNVPYGGKKLTRFPSVLEFRKFANALEHATLRTCDFGRILSETRKGDFVYLDPPYAVSNRRMFKEYGAREFGIGDLERLASHLHRMNQRGVHFVVSYADCAEARNALKGWSIRRILVRRNVAGFHASRRTAYELLASNTADHANSR